MPGMPGMIGRTLTHYKIVGQLGAGGMGVVYSAEDARLGRQVALKFVSTDLAHDEQAISRLRSEARAASALNHPNICTIYDIGEADGHPFIVMELMKGQSLRDRLNAGPLKIAQLVDIGTEVADALHAAHSEGIIHRDIKPANIFITDRGHIKILDFGLAKLTSGLTNATQTERVHTSAAGVTHGTPAYMSPEQATGETLDGRTDLFSLGVVLYECATGHHPFPGKTSAVVLAGILDRAPASPLIYNADLPARLVEIISNCLEKDRELRYQSAADLRADLKRLRRDLDSGAVRSIDRSVTETVATRVVPPSASSRLTTAVPEPVTTTAPAVSSASSASAAPSVSASSASSAPSAVPSSKKWVLTAAAAALVLAVAAAIAFWPRGNEVAAPAVTTPAPATASPATTLPPAPTPAAPPPAPSTEAQLTAADASLKAGNYRAALTSAREVLLLDPANAAAARIRDEATAMLGTFDTAIADARRRLAAHDVEGAARALESARAIDPASPTLVELNARLSEVGRAREAARPAPRGATGPRPLPAAPAPPTGAAPTIVATLPPPPAAPAAPQVSPVSPPPQAEPPRATPPPQEQRAEAAPARTAPAPPPPAKEPAAVAPAASANAADDAAIRSVIASYGRAIENKDIKLFKSIKPNLTAQDERRLQEGFRAVSSQRVSLTVISIEHKGDQAMAVVRRRDDIEAGGRRQTTDARQVLTLARSGSGWTITEIR